MYETLSDDEIRLRLRDALADERRSIRIVLELMIEFDRRDLHRDTPHSSLHRYCTRELGMAEWEAYKKIQAAKAAKRFPVILDLLESGALHTSAVTVLAPHLEPENHLDLLERARGMSKRQLESFVVSLGGPRPVPRDVVKPLPPPLPSPDETDAPILPMEPQSAAVEVAADTTPAPIEAAAPRPEAPAWDASVDDGRRGRVFFTADGETLDHLERLKAIYGRKLKAGQLGPLFKDALKALLREIDPDRQPEPRRRARKEGGRTIPKWIKRAVAKRDGNQCAYRAPDGRRCDSKTWLEYDHIVPYALGGSSDDPANIRLLCRAHNQMTARQVFGSAADYRGTSPPS